MCNILAWIPLRFLFQRRGEEDGPSGFKVGHLSFLMWGGRPW
jgi:hypothetical protein